MPSLSSVPRRLGNLDSGGTASTPGKGGRTVVLEGGSVFVHMHVCNVHVCADILYVLSVHTCSPVHVSMLAGRKGGGP